MITLYSNRADTVKDIAKLLSLDIAAITRLGDRLEAKNLLIRLPDEEDRRLVKFTLTKNGANLVSKLSVEADKNDEAFYGALNDDELLTYQKLLAKLLNAAGTNLEEFCPDFCKKPQIKKTKQPKI